ncbi:MULTISPECIES: thioredoxin family protein [unclassified Sedimentibacter]|uniref:thioredoxin family protein n=1 Tax=unclassified Sedimentibacter TaxID=2649220 RepID=UPI0027E171AF|nr:thioredoxin family protein [Sedimentibacter sp. MB35-C1]WMJ75821.1 thioredoxin family protein [Sedimentibacter sp. MB35-C1]
MKKVKAFYLENCPHCKRAFKMVDALKTKKPEYKDVEIERIEESVHAQIADAYDYYQVPTFYVDEIKVHEGVPSFEKIEEVLKKAIS